MEARQPCHEEEPRRSGESPLPVGRRLVLTLAATWLMDELSMARGGVLVRSTTSQPDDELSMLGAIYDRRYACPFSQNSEQFAPRDEALTGLRYRSRAMGGSPRSADRQRPRGRAVPVAFRGPLPRIRLRPRARRTEVNVRLAHQSKVMFAHRRSIERTEHLRRR